MYKKLFNETFQLGNMELSIYHINLGPFAFAFPCESLNPEFDCFIVLHYHVKSAYVWWFTPSFLRAWSPFLLVKPPDIQIYHKPQWNPIDSGRNLSESPCKCNGLWTHLAGSNSPFFLVKFRHLILKSSFSWWNPHESSKTWGILLQQAMFDFRRVNIYSYGPLWPKIQVISQWSHPIDMDL